MFSVKLFQYHGIFSSTQDAASHPLRVVPAEDHVKRNKTSTETSRDIFFHVKDFFRQRAPKGTLALDTESPATSYSIR